jgi:hypothetical protein
LRQHYSKKGRTEEEHEKDKEGCGLEVGSRDEPEGYVEEIEQEE